MEGLTADRLFVAMAKYLLLPGVGVSVAWFVARHIAIERWERRLARRSRWLVSGIAVVLAVLFPVLLAARYMTWHSFILDLGSYDQKAWLIATRPDVGT